MNRRTILAAGGALAASALTLAACSGGGGGSGDSNHLVLYSSMTDNDLSVFTEIVTEQFPDIDIEIVNGSAGELTTRIQSESGNPQGDMMWGGLDTADGDRYADVFEHWLSEHEEDLLPEYRSPNGFYNVDHLSTVAFAVNTDIEAELGIEINGYEDLLDPRLEGRIAMADPTSSSSAWNNISNIMAVYGYDSPEAWDYLEALLDNGLVIVSSSSIPFAGTEDGEYAVGLTYEDGIAALLKSGASHIRLVYPEEGTSASAFGTAVIAGAPNADLAKDVITYLMSPEGQAAYAERSGTVRMTTSADYTLEYLPPREEITWVERDVEWLTENREAIVEKWTELYTSRNGG